MTQTLSGLEVRRRSEALLFDIFDRLGLLRLGGSFQFLKNKICSLKDLQVASFEGAAKAQRASRTLVARVGAGAVVVVVVPSRRRVVLLLHAAGPTEDAIRSDPIIRNPKLKNKFTKKMDTQQSSADITFVVRGIVREHLSRRGLKDVLKIFDEEQVYTCDDFFRVKIGDTHDFSCLTASK